MAIPTRLKQRIGKATPPVRFEVEKGQIRRFALAIGETSPIHLDEEEARRAGYRSLVAPPTFAAALDATDALFDAMQVEPQALMHAEEEYEYFLPIQAGDLLDVTHTIADIYDKPASGGRLIFYVVETRAHDQRDRPVFKGRRVLVELKR